MNKIIGYDSPLMSLLGKLADLFFLNVITLLCCLPIITIGASLTACYYTALKIKRDEGHVFRNFWNSFRENLFSSTVLYLIFVILGVFMLFLYNMLSSSEVGTMKTFFQGFYFMLLCLYLATTVWLFPIQSRFDNKIVVTIKKSIIISIRYILQTILLVVIWGIWGYLISHFILKLILVFFLFGISFPVYISVKLYNKKFEAIEEAIMASVDNKQDII